MPDASHSHPQNRRIWLIGGTSESAALAKVISQCGFPCTISVTTEAAKALYPPSPTLQVRVDQIDDAHLGEFLQAQNIVAILDASHPYAVNSSHLAISAATHWQLPYLRYERLPLKSPQVPASFQEGKGPEKSVILLPNWETLLAGKYLVGQRVLLTVGDQPLQLFRSWHQKAILFAQVIPSPVAVAAALKAGFPAERLMAIQGPVSEALERALWQQWQISLVLMKVSERPEQEETQRKLAVELGISLVLIDRPILDYPEQTSDLARAVEFCRQQLTAQS